MEEAINEYREKGFPQPMEYSQKYCGITQCRRIDYVLQNTTIMSSELGQITPVAASATQIGSHFWRVAAAAHSVAACAAHAMCLWPTIPSPLTGPQ